MEIVTLYHVTFLSRERVSPTLVGHHSIHRAIGDPVHSTATILLTGHMDMDLHPVRIPSRWPEAKTSQNLSG